MPDIVIHGASSFLGKHFARKLIASNVPFRVVARKSSVLTAIESNPLVTIHRYEKSLQEIEADALRVTSPVVYEFSWNGVFGSERNKDEQLSVNVPLIKDSVDLASRLKAVHWIGIGSQAEYGNLDKKISEIDPLKPTTLYGKSKVECSMMAAEMCRNYGIGFSWLRLFSVYGPDDNHEWLIQYLIREMLSDREINVTKGEQVWDYLYITDIAELLFKMKDLPPVGFANLGSGKGVSVRSIIETIRDITKTKSKINFGAIPYRDDQVMFMEADISRLTSHTGWKPVTGMEEGLRATIESVKKELQKEGAHPENKLS